MGLLTIIKITRYITILIVNASWMNIIISVFDKLIWRTVGPKSFLFGTAQFSLWANGAVNYEFMIILSLTALTLR